MNLKHYAIMIAVAATAASCGDTAKNPGTNPSAIDVSLTQAEKDAGLLTPEVMYKMGRVGAPAVSAEGKVAFTMSIYGVPQNASKTGIYVVDNYKEQTVLYGVAPNRGASVAEGNSPQWSSDGKTLYYMKAGQLWSTNPDGSGQVQMTDVEGGIDAYGIAPTGDRAYYTKKVRVEARESKDVHADMPESKALIYDDLMERHWDYWDRGDYSHIFVAPVDGGKLGTGVDIMPGEPWDAPIAPYFDAGEIGWSNDGKLLAYTCKKLTGTQYATSTDSDIYLYNIAAGTTVNLTEEMPGYDKYPVFSPDDRMIAWCSMERPGNESDKDRLFVMNVDGSDKRYLTAGFDYNAANVLWESGESLLFRAPIEATHQLCRVDLTGSVQVLTTGDHDINDLALTEGGVVAGITTLSRPTELFHISSSNGEMLRITSMNIHIYQNIKMGKVEKRWVTTTDGKQMLTWVIFPPDFDPAKKYPTLLYCQGGPQSVVSQAWSYRWNYQLMAAQGYIVVAAALNIGRDLA